MESAPPLFSDSPEVLEGYGPPSRLPLLFDLYPILIPDDDPATLDIVIMVSHRSSCDLALLCKTARGFIWLSGRDVKNTWPKVYAGCARWHVKETGASPNSFLRNSNSSPGEGTPPTDSDQPSYADVSQGKHLASVQFEYDVTLTSFTHALSSGQMNLFKEDWLVFWSNDSRSCPPLADAVVANIQLLMNWKKWRSLPCTPGTLKLKLAARWKTYSCNLLRSALLLWKPQLCLFNLSVTSTSRGPTETKRAGTEEDEGMAH